MANTITRSSDSVDSSRSWLGMTPRLVVGTELVKLANETSPLVLLQPMILNGGRRHGAFRPILKSSYSSVHLLGNRISPGCSKRKILGTPKEGWSNYDALVLVSWPGSKYTFLATLFQS